ncbi:MAG: efflux RND transporter periplasmic adaptor subunit [Myxococcota bacterium]
MSKKIVVFALILIGAITALALKLTVFKQEFTFAGTIEATKVDISSRVTSVIAKMNVQAGDDITQGQALLSLTCEDISLKARLAESNFKRAQNLFAQGSSSKEAYDLSLNNRDEASLMRSWCQITAPLTGTVLAKYHEPGEMVTPGIKLLTLANLAELYTYIYVPQPDVAKLKLGQKIIGHLPELDMKPFEGKIIEISEQAEFTPKNVQTREERQRLVYAVKVLFANAAKTLKPGMTVEVRQDYD